MYRAQSRCLSFAYCTLIIHVLVQCPMLACAFIVHCMSGQFALIISRVGFVAAVTTEF